MKNSEILNLKKEIFYTIFDTIKFNGNLNIYIIYASFPFHKGMYYWLILTTLIYNINNSWILFKH